ncbi:TlpA disulfide reductase family protein [Dactylosporangium sp. NPDC050588]|uniref:TlpA family protein disulfide reductase n=1 Tax=Dactylosporangium sp. NPDC050588 TaxID=3157211 RepID=UPI0033F78E4E
MVSTHHRVVACTIVAVGLAAAWYLQDTATTTGPGDVAARPSATAIVQVPPASRQAAPALTGQLLDASAFRLAEWRGYVVVVNFWASWCAPCGDEAPDLQAVADATAGLSVRMLGVNINDDRDEARKFVDAYHLTYPSLFDPAGEIPLIFPAISPRTLPNTVILDRAGNVAAVARRKVTRTELEAAVRALLAESVATG